MRTTTSRAALAVAVGLLLLFAAPAHAGITDPPDDVVDQATGTVDGTVAAAQDAVDDVAQTVSDVTGGASDPVTDPVQDVIDKTEDVAGETENTVDDVVSGAESAVDDAVDAADEATGGVIGDVTGRDDDQDSHDGGNRPQSGFSARPVAGRRSLHARSSTRFDPTPRGNARPQAATLPIALRRASAGTATSTAPAPSLGERLRQAAIDAARRLALPLGLTLIVLGFVLAQYWADRKEPKLAFAPVESDHDLLVFQ